MLKTFSKWFLRLLVLLIVLSLGFLIWYKSEIKSTYGANTELVDHAAFTTSLKLTAITNTNVLSPDGQNMLPNRTVILDNGKIISVAAEVALPIGAKSY